MKTRFFFWLMLPILILNISSGLVFAEPHSLWKLPPADAQKWSERIRSFLRKDWTVSVRGNDILIQREKPVRFGDYVFNAPPHEEGDPEPADNVHEGSYQFTLRFAPKMSMDEYERLDKENTARENKLVKLRKELGIHPKSVIYLSDPKPTDDKRIQTYRAAAAKLPWHTLPNLYTTDYSIFLFQPGNAFTGVLDKDAGAECENVLQKLSKYFGVYDPLIVDGRHELRGFPDESLQLKKGK